MNKSEIDILLQKYIQQRCNPEELVWVTNYIQLPEGKLALERLLTADWNTFEPQPASMSDAENWFDRLEARTAKPATSFAAFQYNWIKYAALFILLSGFAFWFIIQGDTTQSTMQIAMVEKYNPKGKRTQIILQDGSVVHLGSDSRLRYPEKLNQDTREISLEGEAFFEIKHDEKRPFIVHTGKVQTQVLGTSFKIEAFKNHQLSVAVATGKVSVGYKQQDKKLKSLAILTPGRKLSWDPVSHQSATTNLAINDIKGWKDGTLVFTDARLDDISAELERWYNTRIIIKDAEVNAYILSIGVNGKAPITSALDAITGAAGLKYKIDHNQITISMIK